MGSTVSPNHSPKSVHKQFSPPTSVQKESETLTLTATSNVCNCGNESATGTRRISAEHIHDGDKQPIESNKK